MARRARKDIAVKFYFTEFLLSPKRRLYIYLGILAVFDFVKKGKLKNSLIEDLKAACEIASHYSGGYSGEFLDAKEFYQALNSTVNSFDEGDDDKVKYLWIWFAPTSAWDDFIGTGGRALGDSIFTQLQAYIDNRGIEI